MAWDDSAQLGIVCSHEPRNVSELWWVLSEAQNSQIGLIDRGIERKVSDQCGMPVVENGKAVLECYEERCGGTAVRARWKGIIMGTWTDFELDAFQNKLVANTSPLKLLLLESISD